ncbi:aspartic proteinase Asp1-like, partial [Olea europaea var. sylvestris]|uniref:aspartic proteinase Asp1-like n=1 Tax=Olea europaea var. sylvestris TaxID=158386 RepID=UPI000C1D301A
LQPFGIYRTPHDPYTTSNNLVSCEDDAVCGLVGKPVNPQCSQQNQQCDYQVEYADHCSTLGVLVKDVFLFSSSLKRNPSQSTHTLIFGCGYHQEFDDSFSSPFTDGVLGLGTGKTSILSRLSDQGLIKKVMALCLSEINPGYLVLGDSKSNLPETIWMPFSNDHIKPYNMLGPADMMEIFLLRDCFFFFFLLDSGTTYNYFSPTLYQDVLSLVKELAEKTAAPVEDSYLPVCWRPFASSQDFLYSFSSLNLSFTGKNNVYFELSPTDYLIVSVRHKNLLEIIINEFSSSLDTSTYLASPLILAS